MTEAEQLRDWANSLRRISADVRDTLTRRLIFREVQEIQSRNRRLQKLPAVFSRWMAANYIAASSLAVRRQIVRDTKSICFDQLLEDMFGGGTQLLFFSREFSRATIRGPISRGWRIGCSDKFAWAPAVTTYHER